ncbi:MAG: hypothetical protein AAGN46_11095 [Acidobacteriota bacterium]
MNFLWHRYLARRDLGSTEAGVGAMLPDLWRMADRRARPGRLQAMTPPALGDLADGVEHHLAVDAWFHTRPAFDLEVRATAAALRDRAPRSARLGLFAHAAWELCLDGALLRRDGIATTRAALQRELTDEAMARSVDLLVLHRTTTFSGADRTAVAERLNDLAERLRTSDWIDGYADGEGLAARLDGLRARLGFEPLTPAERGHLAIGLDERLRAAEATVEDLETSWRRQGARHAEAAS